MPALASVEDQVVLALVADLGAAVLAVDDDVADGDVHGDEVAGLAATAGADGDDFTLLGLFLGGVRDDETAGGGGLSFAGADHDAVLEGLQAHSILRESVLYVGTILAPRTS